MKVKIDNKCYFECDNIPRYLVTIKTNKKRKRIRICYKCYYQYVKQIFGKNGVLSTTLTKDDNCKIISIYDIETGIHKLVKGAAIPKYERKYI